MILSGKTKLAGVMGWPVAHSRSPRLQGYWIEHHGLDAAYVPLPVHPDNFKSALHALRDLGFRGVNITVPHKEAALAACDDVDAQARRIAAVNTITFQDGRILGGNSDAFGFLENLRQEAPQWKPGAGPALVLGAGGAARAVVAALLDSGVPQVRIANRTLERAQQLANDFGPSCAAVPWGDRTGGLADTMLLVNATSLGMTGQAALEINIDALPPAALVTDIVYTPLETPLLAVARACGNTVVDGLGMLLHQARPGFEAWFGVAPAVTPALRQFVLAE